MHGNLQDIGHDDAASTMTIYESKRTMHGWLNNIGHDDDNQCCVDACRISQMSIDSNRISLMRIIGSYESPTTIQFASVLDALMF